MKRFKVGGVGLLAVCAMLLVALPVTAASAKKAKGVLQVNEWNEEKEEWVEAGAGAPGFIQIYIDHCVLQAAGHLTGNKAATVTMDGGTGEQTSCPPTEGEAVYTVSGEVKSVSLTAKKKAAHLTASVTVDEEGCRYTFTKFPKSMKLEIPGRLEAEGPVTAKGSKSNPAGCAKSRTVEVGVALESANFKILKTELVS